MSKAKYLSHLEKQISASRKVLDDLVKENYELKNLLREAAKKPTTPSQHIS
jgi:hypothetical protein